MISGRWLCIGVCLVFFTIVGIGHAGGHGQPKAKKVGILLVAFGSSDASARVAYDHIDTRVKKVHPAIPVRWAYTSYIVRKKLTRQGQQLDSPMVALSRMADEAFTHVAVQSLHIIAGAEFHDLQRTVAGFRAMGCFQQLSMGAPLMGTQQDMRRIVDAALAAIPETRTKDEAVVLMGHGTRHPANAFYAALMFQLQRQDPNVFLGTVEGYPGLDLIQTMLTEKKVTKVYLMPFMAVAGDHAKNDMAGDADDSWQRVLGKAGFECVPVLKGIAEYDAYVDIWMAHLDAALQQ